MTEYPIEINWEDVAQKLTLELVDAHRDAAARYAMCESLKREIKKLRDEKVTAIAGSE